MTKSDAASSATASSSATERSRESAEGFDLERDIPTTAEDVRALRELRCRLGENLLPQIHLLSLAQFENIPQRRTTSEGWEPFTLEDDD